MRVIHVVTQVADNLCRGIPARVYCYALPCTFFDTATLMHCGARRQDLLPTGDDMRHMSGPLASTVRTLGTPTLDPSLGDLVGFPNHTS